MMRRFVRNNYKGRIFKMDAMEQVIARSNRHFFNVILESWGLNDTIVRVFYSAE